MFWRVTPGGFPGFAGRREAIEGRRESQKQRAQPRGRQIDEIVEPRRGPAEIHKTRRAMADYAVGGVDCLIEDRAGETAGGQPKGWRDNAIGKVLGEAFDRGPRDARFVEIIRDTADDLADGAARGLKTVALQSIGNRAHVFIKRALRQ